MSGGGGQEGTAAVRAHVRSLTLGQLGHQLESPALPQLGASALLLLAVREGRRGGVAPVRHVTHLHGPARQLEAVQLLQSLFATLGICKLRRQRGGSAQTPPPSAHGAGGGGVLTVMKP